MSNTDLVPEPRHSTAADLAAALDRLVARGALTPQQAAEVRAEALGEPVASAVVGTAAPAAPSGAPRVERRSMSQLLVEVGLYVGSALVVASLVVLVAQSWEGLSVATQAVTLGATALVAAGLGVWAAHGALAATARRRLAGVLMCAAAAASAGTVALLVGDDAAFVGVAALGTALAVLVLAQVVAASAVTEVALFAVSFMLVQVLGQELRPEPTTQVDGFGDEIAMTTTFDRLLPLAAVAFGLLWSLGISRVLLHHELAVALGLLATATGALPLAGTPETRAVGLVALAALATIGFWRFLVEGLWPWLAGAIASLTALVFWLVGGAHSPALAILAAGLVMLATSAASLQWTRHRQRQSRHRAS